ncbi:RluA family pseudouridine synthase [Erysipelothrix sp. HDW6B]|uniref:RluA family pseudouridine synthase n=1 Tax=Erysipelothrix TaxID=1647 RepID=UPI00135A2972|nr:MULTISPECIES: RluA family pseudouridine synthase [Erysipelothrix]QIK85815.1 RluA family pseudouridine synthase [Erysipelothrix sp. HDW6B]
MNKIMIDEQLEGIRIDQYMALLLGDYSRSVIQAWIEDGKILVNDKTTKRNYRLKESDVVSYEITEKDTTIQPIKMDLDIVYEDEHLMVVNKPKGLIVHPSPSTLNQATLVHGLLAHTNHLSDLNGELRPGIVHRLDKDTSGLLIVAKTNEAHELLVEALKNREISREYYALVHHAFPHQSATVDAPIGRDTRNRQRMTVTDKNSKEAVTHLFLVEKFKDHSLLRCKLETGRTHQIRVHCSYIQHPIVGDATYSYKNTLDTQGQCLHAFRLKFTHPITHEALEFESQMPQIMQDTIDEVRRLDS